MSGLLFAVVSSMLVADVAASCAYGTTLMPRATEGEVHVNTFGYSGSIGPANWHSLDTSTNGVCATGKNQSPIDLVDGTFTETPGSSLELSITNFDKGATFENLGTTVEVVGEGGTLAIPDHDNKTFNFKQFHFHLPSEHLDNGTSMAMEMHMVFQADDSEIAVLGLYIDVEAGSGSGKRAENTRRSNNNNNNSCGKSSSSSSSSSSNSTSNNDINPGTSDASGTTELLETVFASVGKISTPGTSTTTAALSMDEVVSHISATTFKSYSGSLTTPPCSEGVNWFVAADTLSISLSSWKSARDVLGYNSRFPQNAPGETNILSLAAASL